jgi:GDP-4-dehydro-6-deoxy-D-mannose reductase
MKSVLITGATGQTASYLCDYILQNHKEYQIHCTRRWRSREENIWTFRDKVHWHSCEMKDQFNVYHTIKKMMPERIFVFSASSFVRDSWLHPQEYMNENISHLLNVMNAILMINNVNLDDLTVKLSYNPKIFVALSSEEYGKVKHDTIITEETPLLPISPYGVSKCAIDLLAFQYHQSYGMNNYRFRIFNNESPRRGHIFVTGSFCKQVALIETGDIDPVLHVGNTASIRDWTDSKDIVKAIWIGMNDGNCFPGEVYNICSGIPHTIDEFIERLRELSAVEFRIKVDSNRMRPSDVDYLLGDCSKFKKATGWKPEFDFINDTVPDMLNYWRKRVKSSKHLFLEELIQ